MAIHQVRQARLAKGKALPIEWGAQKTEAYGAATESGTELKVPTKARAFDTYPVTGQPEGSESPVRGEHPNIGKKEGR